PVALPTGVSVKALAAGGEHSLALGSDGTVYAWGYDGFGALGGNTQTDRTIPIKVKFPARGTITALAAGAFNVLALRTHGTIYAWGDNTSGQLGVSRIDSSPDGSPTPVKLLAGIKIKALAAGKYHSLAVGSDGTVYAWGDNTAGELGGGSTTDGNYPVKV